MIPALINQMMFSRGATAAPATPPSFVNGGIIAESTSPSTGTLPGSRVTGNLLVLYFKSRNTANDPSVSAGWTQLDTFGFGGASQRFGVYYCFVTGSEIAPVITCAGGGAIVSVVAQYSGACDSTPVVAGSKNGGTGTAITTAAITSSVNAILAVSASWDDTSTSPTQPSGFNNEGTGIFQNVFGSLRLCDITITTAGSSSPSVSCTGGNSPWGAFLFEMRQCGCPASAAFLARTSGLDATHVAAYRALICGLVSDGVWAKLDVLHIYATQDSTTALLNLISSSYNGIAHGSPTFTADSGYTGTDNSTTIYIDTGFNPVTATTPQYAQDSSHLSIWVPTNLQNDIPAMGSVNLGDSIENLIEPRNTGGIATYHIQSQATIAGAVVTPVSNGHSLVTRPAASSLIGYKDGGSVVSSATGAQAVLSLNMYSLGFNFGGTAKGSATPQSMISIGGGLSATDAANFYSRLRTYMTTVGVP